MFCTCTRPCACADGAKIVRCRDAQCNTKELLLPGEAYLNAKVLLKCLSELLTQ